MGVDGDRGLNPSTRCSSGSSPPSRRAAARAKLMECGDPFFSPTVALFPRPRLTNLGHPLFLGSLVLCVCATHHVSLELASSASARVARVRRQPPRLKEAPVWQGSSPPLHRACITDAGLAALHWIEDVWTGWVLTVDEQCAGAHPSALSGIEQRTASLVGAPVAICYTRQSFTGQCAASWCDAGAQLRALDIASVWTCSALSESMLTKLVASAVGVPTTADNPAVLRAAVRAATVKRP